MSQSLEPVRSESLQDACARRMEAKILSGEWQPGQHLRPERTLAEELQVSRPVVHQALVDLAAKGFVHIVPRRGVSVCDYQSTGSLAMLAALLDHHDQDLDPGFIREMIDTRKLIETETARLAALRRTPEQLAELDRILAEESEADREESALLTRLDFRFHLQIAIASANRIYPMILNSFKGVYTRMTGTFFSRYTGGEPVQGAFAFHTRITDSIRRQDADTAAQLMADMLDEGARFLLQIGGHNDD